MSLLSRVSAFLSRRRARGEKPEFLSFTDPVQLSDHLAYIILYAPHFPPEDQFTSARAFEVAFNALNRFASHAASSKGREALGQCSRSLRAAFELYEIGDVPGGTRLVQEADALFQGARKYLDGVGAQPPQGSSGA